MLMQQFGPILLSSLGQAQNVHGVGRTKLIALGGTPKRRIVEIMGEIFDACISGPKNVFTTAFNLIGAEIQASKMSTKFDFLRYPNFDFFRHGQIFDNISAR
jgi:hypothetical protein